jgi:hypothetical protein
VDSPVETVGGVAAGSGAGADVVVSVGGLTVVVAPGSAARPAAGERSAKAATPGSVRRRSRGRRVRIAQLPRR